MKTVSTYFTAAKNFETYRLTPQAQKYNGHIYGNISKWAKRMEVGVKSSIFKPADPIYIAAFRHIFKTACDSNGIHEEAAIWLFPHFMKEMAKAALSYRKSSSKDNNTQKKRTLTTYCQVINFPLETYAADEVTAKAERNIMSYKQPKNMFAVCYLATV